MDNLRRSFSPERWTLADYPVFLEHWRSLAFQTFDQSHCLDVQSILFKSLKVNATEILANLPKHRLTRMKTQVFTYPCPEVVEQASVLESTEIQKCT